MNPTCITFLLVAFLAASSCTRQDEKSPQLIEANRLHLEAIETAKHLEAKLEKLAARVGNGSERSQIDSLKNLIEVWEENQVEVPGFAHAHDHGAHSHKAAPPMTDESMLDYQRQSMQAIIELRDAITKLDSLQK